MSHAGNWSPAKRARMAHALSADAAAERERAMVLTPAMTRGKGWKESALGCGCPLQRPIRDRYLQIPDRLMKEPWVCIMRRHLRCSVCNERPHYLSFVAWRDLMWMTQAKIELES